MSGICDTCQRNQVCRRPMDGMDSCRLYVSGRESNYEKLFGTPERAARTLARMDVDACNWCVNSSGNPEDCKSCPYEYDYYGCYLPEKFSMLEWLKSEVVE